MSIGIIGSIKSRIEQVCELCPSKYCADCKISVKTNSRRIIVNGMSRKIERVERIPNLV